jgi:hypothetical protein
VDLLKNDGYELVRLAFHLGDKGDAEVPAGLKQNLLNNEGDCL